MARRRDWAWVGMAEDMPSKRRWHHSESGGGRGRVCEGPRGAGTGMLEKSPGETGGPLTTSILNARVKTEEASKWRSDMIPIYILEMPAQAAG